MKSLGNLETHDCASCPFRKRNILRGPVQCSVEIKQRADGSQAYGAHENISNEEIKYCNTFWVAEIDRKACG